MFKVGDKIRIRKKYHYLEWYSEDTYNVIDIDIERSWVFLDKPISDNYSNCIHFDYIIQSFIYERELKINKIKEKIHGIIK